MMPLGIFHHVGILVKNREQAHRIAWHYRLFGQGDFEPFLNEQGDPEAHLFFKWEPVPEFKCFCCFLREYPMLEFICPESGSLLEKFLHKNETAMHHLAFEVPDITRLPLEPLFKTAVKGAGNLLVNFFQPFEGVLVEVVRKFKPRAE